MRMSKSATVKAAQIVADAQKLLDYMDREGFDGGTGTRPRRTHMGGLIVESAMQAGQDYVARVVPRAKGLVEAWPDADTTSGFLDRIATGTLSQTVRWPDGGRLMQMQATAETLASEGIDTVDQLRERFEDETTRPELRSVLRRIRGIGNKTTDFIEILSGSEKVAAIDIRILRATGRAGIERTDYDYLQDVLHYAAGQRGWTPASLDAVLWNNHPD